MEQQSTVIPYFILEDASAFGRFTRDVFDAREVSTRLREDHTLMHAELQIGNSRIMYCDSTEAYPPVTGSLFIYVPDADSSYRKALEAGASVVMELSDQDYGRTCGVLDPCGVTWWITSERK
ncbi:MAG TPA: VOC family protein [Chitinophagaceae bacterium]|jgi:uncharacterized glyoxalase superfamily protein PhnB|nr:VOC family protein [Chitinophagaceae bacterium]